MTIQQGLNPAVTNADAPCRPEIRPLSDRLRAIVGFLPKFEEPGFEFGWWVPPREIEPRHFTMPYFELSDSASAFLRAAYDAGWVLRGFRWPEWIRAPEAQKLRDNPEALSQATPDQLARLLTLCIRQDRFVDGVLEAAFNSGLLTGILRRAAAILSEIDDGGPVVNSDARATRLASE